MPLRTSLTLYTIPLNHPLPPNLPPLTYPQHFSVITQSYLSTHASQGFLNLIHHPPQSPPPPFPLKCIQSISPCLHSHTSQHMLLRTPSRAINLTHHPTQSRKSGVRLCIVLAFSAGIKCQHCMYSLQSGSYSKHRLSMGELLKSPYIYILTPTMHSEAKSVIRNKFTKR